MGYLRSGAGKWKESQNSSVVCDCFVLLLRHNPGDHTHGQDTLASDRRVRVLGQRLAVSRRES